MMNAKHALLKRGFPLLAAATLLVAGQDAMAASFTVRVVDAETLSPVPGASVCMGSATAPGEHGTTLTDKNGEARYTRMPGNDFVLSVADGAYASYSREMVSRDFDVIYYVELGHMGDQFANCVRAGEVWGAKLQGRAALELVNIDVRAHSHSSGTVDIATEVRGLVPTHIRASTDPEFSNARWLPYRAVTRHEVEEVSSENLYVQVKRSAAVEGGDVEAHSVLSIGDLHWD